MKTPVLAANWKMNLAPADAREFMLRFLDQYPRRNDRMVLFFPSALSFATAHGTLPESRADIQFGVQNIHWEDKGAFTGENSAAIARSAGAKFALIGHSERRHVFGESDAETGQKVAAAVRAKLTPVICIGETLAQREAGDTTAVCIRQLRAALAECDPKTLVFLIAYEPVWAIGTGKNATPEDASAVHQAIRAELKTLVGERAEAVPILYGGSVNRGNAPQLLAAPEVDGLLVGGASLDADGWATICGS